MVLTRVANFGNQRPQPSPRTLRVNQKRSWCVTLAYSAASTIIFCCAIFLALKADWRSLNPSFYNSKPLFADVIGCEAAKERLRGYVALLKRPSIAHSVGLEGIPALVFYGPDGSGTRTLAMAAATEAGASLVELDLEQLIFASFLV